jgi:hypothetical protein
MADYYKHRHNAINAMNQQEASAAEREPARAAASEAQKSAAKFWLLRLGAFFGNTWDMEAADKDRAAVMCLALSDPWAKIETDNSGLPQRRATVLCEEGTTVRLLLDSSFATGVGMGVSWKSAHKGVRNDTVCQIGWVDPPARQVFFVAPKSEKAMEWRVRFGEAPTFALENSVDQLTLAYSLVNKRHPHASAFSTVGSQEIQSFMPSARASAIDEKAPDWEAVCHPDALHITFQKRERKRTRLTVRETLEKALQTALPDVAVDIPEMESLEVDDRGDVPTGSQTGSPADDAQ